VAKRREVVVIDEGHLLSVRGAVSDFLKSSEWLKELWKGALSSIEEVQMMRKRQRGY
jgi:hypothetical protein